ncbi:MAG: hypothetical protein ACLSDJ_01060 [Butyricimonas faecihominis]
MVTANYQPVNYSGSDLIDFIRDERRRELCFEDIVGLIYVDML